MTSTAGRLQHPLFFDIDGEHEEHPNNMLSFDA